MKQKLIVAACVVAIIVGTVLSVRVSDRWVSWQNDRAAKEVAATMQQVALDNDRQQKVAQRIDRLYKGCVAGQKSFDALTATQRRGQVRAVCDF